MSIIDKPTLSQIIGATFGSVPEGGGLPWHRRAKRGGGESVVLPSAIGSGATFWLRQDGITESVGTVASWDSEGSNTVRFSADNEAERPAAKTQGSLTVADFDGSDDQLVAESSLQLVRPYTIGVVVAVQTWVGAGTYIWSPDTPIRNYLSAIGGTPNKFRWNDGTVLLETTTNVAAGAYVSLILRSDTEQSPGADGTAYMLLNGVQEDTDTVPARTNTSNPWSIGARIDGASPGDIDLVDFAVWNGEYLDDDAVALLDAYHNSVKAKL